MTGGQERTERATPKRLEKARAEGNVARSTLAPVALALLFIVIPMWFVEPFVRWWAQLFERWATLSASMPSAAGYALAQSSIQEQIWAAPPWNVVAGACVAAAFSTIGSSIACGAAGWAGHSIRLRLNRLAPQFRGASPLDGANYVQAGFAIAGAGGLLACAVEPMCAQLTAAGTALTIASEAAVLKSVLVTFWARAAGLLLALAVIDVAVARRHHAMRLRMTPREVRDERAEQEAKPELKGRRRSIGLARTRKLRIAAIKRATVVVTNPSHVAVALRYAPPDIDVPLVVSAGRDLAASLVRGAALAFDVPIVEAPELARALYARAGTDEPIPEELYAAVAAIFAWILKTRGTLRGVAH